jgi:hypothetical protein
LSIVVIAQTSRVTDGPFLKKVFDAALMQINRLAGAAPGSSLPSASVALRATTRGPGRSLVEQVSIRVWRA